MSRRPIHVVSAFVILAGFAGLARASPWAQGSEEPAVIERKGCCSHHKGVCGCESGSAKCCDGSLSPTCGC
jgi:hypothetical protein